jgi:hypothetical protein
MKWVSDSFAKYRAVDAINASFLKTFITRSPAHAHHERLHPKTPTPAMEFGTAVHDHILLDRPLVVEPEFKGAGSVIARKSWRNEYAGTDALIVDTDEAQAIAGIKKQVDGLGILRPGVETEHSGYFENYKIRCDAINFETGVIYDIKTTADASSKSFPRDIFKYGYDIQAAWYLHVANAINADKFLKFYFIAIEKSAPHGISIFELSQDVLDNATKKINRALSQIRDCQAAGYWPCYEPDSQIVELPKWEAFSE